MWKKWDKVVVSNCKLSVEEFLHLIEDEKDEKISTGENLCNSYIIELIKGKEEEGENDSAEEIVHQTISKLQAKIHLEELKYYLSNTIGFDSSDIEFLERLYTKLDSDNFQNKVQKKLESFF